jgi:hypothetical protein
MLFPSHDPVQDVLLKTLLGVPNLIDLEKVAKADRDDQRKD